MCTPDHLRLIINANLTKEGRLPDFIHLYQYDQFKEIYKSAECFFFYLTSFFGPDFFKFSDPLCTFLAHRKKVQFRKAALFASKAKMNGFVFKILSKGVVPKTREE